MTARPLHQIFSMIGARPSQAHGPMRRHWWQFRLTTLLLASPLLTLLLVAATNCSPFWWKASNHDVAVHMHKINARSNRDWSVRRPAEAADYLRFAAQADARVTYHQSMSRKYWHLAARPWLWFSIPPDPPPPP